MASNHDFGDIPVCVTFLLKLATHSGAKLLSMSCFPCVLALIGTKVVGGCVIFTETRKSGLDLPGFCNKFCQKGDNYIKAIIIWSKFWSINDFILQN